VTSRDEAAAWNEAMIAAFRAHEGRPIVVVAPAAIGVPPRASPARAVDQHGPGTRLRPFVRLHRRCRAAWACR